jgi:hypothetical protein
LEDAVHRRKRWRGEWKEKQRLARYLLILEEGLTFGWGEVHLH